MKKVMVLLEVTVEGSFGPSAKEVREHIAAEAQASRGQFTGFGADWRAEIEVKLKPYRRAK